MFGYGSRRLKKKANHIHPFTWSSTQRSNGTPSTRLAEFTMKRHISARSCRNVIQCLLLMLACTPHRRRFIFLFISHFQFHFISNWRNEKREKHIGEKSSCCEQHVNVFRFMFCAATRSNRRMSRIDRFRCPLCMHRRGSAYERKLEMFIFFLLSARDESWRCRNCYGAHARSDRRSPKLN